MAPQTAISKAVCYKTKNEQLWEKAVHLLFVATNCFYAGLPTVFCTITSYGVRTHGVVISNEVTVLHLSKIQQVENTCFS